MLASVRWTARSIVVAGAVWASAIAPPVVARAAAQAGTTGVVTGVVTDGATKRPLPNAQVAVEGTRFGALTNGTGEFRIANVPAGQALVRVRLIGYGPQSHTVTVETGQTARVEFVLQQSALQLSDVVTTGTGVATETKKAGNTIAQINTEDLKTAPIQSPTEVLQGRVPGVSALPSSGLTGEGARIRIRGNASLSQSNEAVLYIDGVRADNGGGFGDNVGSGGGGNPSRFDDIDPQSIEKVEILKGAAAATLYGTEASNGVIQVFTKRGIAGPPRWSFQAERSELQFPDRIHPNAGFARTPEQAALLSQFYSRDVKPFEVFTTRLTDRLEETGFGNNVSGSVSGGSPSVTYYVSGRYYYEDGPFTSNLGGRTADNQPYRGLAEDVNRKYQATANLNLFPRDNIRIGFRTLYADARQATPGNNNNIYAPFTLAQFGKPELAYCLDLNGEESNDAIAGNGRCKWAGNEFGNAAFATTREALVEDIHQDATHFNGVLTAAYLPLASLTLDATIGLDQTNARSVDFVPFGNAVDQFSERNPNGERSLDNKNVQTLTLESKGSWAYDFARNLNSTFVFGGQGFVTRTNISGGFNYDFPGQIEIIGAGSSPTIEERFIKVVNAGVFAQEQLGYNDWIYGTVGGRYDRNSAFGQNAGGIFYPKASLSVVPSDLPSWKNELLSTLRLRGAIGRSGRQPGAFDKFTTYQSLPSDFGGGLVPSNLGNQDLKPEVSTEAEGGAELGLFNNKLGLNGTYWTRTVKDALVAKQYPPSGGFRFLQLTNVGKLTAHGLELSATGYLVNRPTFSLDLFANGAYIKQKVVSLGGAAPLKVGGSYPRYRNFLKEGYAPGALFGAKLMAPCSSYHDPATDAKGGCLQPGELPYDLNKDGKPDTEADLRAYFAANPSVTLSSMNPLRADDDGDKDFLDHYEGKPYPDWQGGFGGNVRFLKNFRLSSLFEYKAGNYTVQNLTDAFRNANPVIGRNTLPAAKAESDLLNPQASVDAKLAAAKEWLKLKALSPYDGLNQNSNGAFMRWRELSLTWTAPEKIAHTLAARDASFTFAVRNLMLWTKYNGTDPEINAVGRGSGEGGTDENYLDAVDAFGFPLARRFSFAVRLGF